MDQSADSSASQENVASQGGETTDFQSLFQELESTKEQAGRVTQELESVKGSAQKSNETIERMKHALMGEQPGASKDPVDSQIANLESQMDDYLQAAIDAERAGKPIPLTINSAVSSIKFQINALNENREMKKQLAMQAAQLKQLSNPANSIDQMAFGNIDSHVITALNSIYGEGDDNRHVKGAQFEAVTKRIATEIRDLQQNQPDLWDRVRRSKEAQTKLVNHFIKESIPPRARQLMEEDQIKRTPLSQNELLSAYREAKELALQDPKAKKYVSELRQELLSRLWEKNAGNSSRLKANDLL